MSAQRCRVGVVCARMFARSFVSCNLEGYIGPGTTVTSATLSLIISSVHGISPMGSTWVCDAGVGPVQLQMEMVMSMQSLVPRPPCTLSMLDSLTAC